MEEGLWTAIFSHGSLAGGGVIYLTAGKLVGGDGEFYYVGEYTFDPTTKALDAFATVLPFVAGAITIFGMSLPKYEIRLSGVIGHGEASITGSVVGNAALILNIKLVKRLPKFA